jgi:hypothetical protein
LEHKIVERLKSDFPLRKILILVSGIIVLASIAVAITANNNNSDTPTAKQVRKINVQPLDTTHGVTFASIPEADSAKQVAFLQAGAKKYNLENYENSTPRVVVNACMLEETNKFQDFAQSDLGHKLSKDDLQKRLDQLKPYCYKTYSSDGQVPPDPPLRDPHHIH